jgi:hypothetical protein
LEESNLLEENFNNVDEACVSDINISTSSLPLTPPTTKKEKEEIGQMPPLYGI